MSRTESTLWLAIGLVFTMMLASSCILGPIGASQLNSDQMKALHDYNDTGDVYACLLAGGPPPAGTLVAVVVPKGAPIDVTFGPDCHGTVKSQGAAPNNVFKGL